MHSFDCIDRHPDYQRGTAAMEHLVIIGWDSEGSVWYAVCDSIPLALESESLDKLILKVKVAAPEMLALNNIALPEDSLCLKFELREKIA